MRSFKKKHSENKFKDHIKGDTIHIRFLGTHHEESIHTRLVCFLIDNVLAVDAGSLSSELTFKEQRDIKAILLSHEHYDHIKCIPSFIFNNLDRSTQIIASQATLDIISSHLFDGVIYPKFTEKTEIVEQPPIKFAPIKPMETLTIEGYQVLALPGNHATGSIQFEITSPDGKKLMYTGDTGPDLTSLWSHIKPDLMILDVTFPNSMETIAKNASHLCPCLLEKELLSFNEKKGYYPQIVLIHLSPKYEKEIQREIQQVAKKLKTDIIIAHEGQTVSL